MQGHILEEWRIRDVERAANQALSRLWELDSLRSDVASLVHTVREISSLVDGLRSELQACKDENEELRGWIEAVDRRER